MIFICKHLQIPEWSGDVKTEIHEGDDVDHVGQGDDWDTDNIQQHKSSWYTSGAMNKLLQSTLYIPILTVMKWWNCKISFETNFTLFVITFLFCYNI